MVWARSVPRSSATPDPRPEPFGPLRILVVDDNRDATENMALLLEARGHTVRVAHDGEEALILGEQFRPEVALVDIGMPKMDGHEVAERMRQSPWGRVVYLIALTGWGQESDRRRSEAAGFDAHLVKPVSPDKLVSILNARNTPGEVPAR